MTRGDGEFLPDEMLVQQLDEAFSSQPIDNQTKSELIQKVISSLGHSDFWEQYLANVSTQLARYANDKPSQPLSVAVFYNSDSSYSQELKTKFIDKLEALGDSYTEVNIADRENFGNSFDATDAESAIAELSINDASDNLTKPNVVFLAFSQTNIDQAIALAKAVRADEDLDEVLLMGGEELYHPATLVEGGSAIEGLVLAVPWSWKEAYELKLRSLDDSDELPTEGESLVIAAKIGNSYRVRIFDRMGNMVIDKEKDEFSLDPTLVRQLNNAPSDQSIDNPSKIEFIQKIASSLDDTFAEQADEERFVEQAGEDRFAQQATAFWEGRRVSWRTRTAYIFTNIFARAFIDDDSDQSLTRKRVDEVLEQGIRISETDAKDLYPSESCHVSLVSVVAGSNSPRASRYRSNYQFTLIDSEILRDPERDACKITLRPSS